MSPSPLMRPVVPSPAPRAWARPATPKVGEPLSLQPDGRALAARRARREEHARPPLPGAGTTVRYAANTANETALTVGHWSRGMMHLADAAEQEAAIMSM